ncbi:MAG: heavy metal translocating P-type ATPase [Planctomycetia bacterium]|nr:heavy metal translocating P-type ATPase [Planctomycetia bacterium]
MSSTIDRSRLAIALLAVIAIVVHLILRYAVPHPEVFPWWVNLPLWIALVLGGIPLVFELVRKALNREFGSDLLAGISIVTSVILGEYLAGVFVVLMLSGGEALESYAVQSASSVLRALAKRMPAVAHRKEGNSTSDVKLDAVAIGDILVVHPHEICPVDGTVLEGHGSMDESYLTGEPYLLPKSPGTSVLSGSINGESVLVIKADKLAVDSRYAKIMQVMRDSEQHRPQLRRLGDQLGAWYTPIAVGIALLAWALSGEAIRFLAVLVVATPCPLLIAIPVAIIGGISLAARRGIIIKNPAALETIETCQTAIFDKTGTLTYGKPELTEIITAPGYHADDILRWTASLEQYSKHPLASAILHAAERKGLPLVHTDHVSEKPGQGLSGKLLGKEILVSHRRKFLKLHPDKANLLPPIAEGMECLILVNGEYAAVIRFRDRPRSDGKLFIDHLRPRHGIKRTLLVSGDRESEVEYLAKMVGITETYSSQTPEQKLELVRKETAAAPTVFVGDGINDAPALTAASVGIAFGQNSDITSEAADVVILESSLAKVDELLHIGQRMRNIALQSAVGGMALSVIGMLIAAAGYLPPVAGAICQEIIDVFAVLNALRVAWRPKQLTDF